jgi:hypothetical protein
MKRRLRRWGALALPLALLALVASAAPAAAGVDDQPFAMDGPWIIEVGPEIAVIPEAQASFVIVSDAVGSARACGATRGCTAVVDEEVGAVVIVDQSAASPAPASPAASAAPSGLGAVPR